MDAKVIIAELYTLCYEVRNILGSGFLEKVYENALCQELRAHNIPYRLQPGLIVKYKEAVVGEYRPDIIVDDKVIIELKAVETICRAHEAQLVNYLTATGIDDGVLVNFGNAYAFRHKTRIYQKTVH